MAGFVVPQVLQIVSSPRRKSPSVFIQAVVGSRMQGYEEASYRCAKPVPPRLLSFARHAVGFTPFEPLTGCSGRIGKKPPRRGRFSVKRVHSRGYPGHAERKKRRRKLKVFFSCRGIYSACLISTVPEPWASASTVSVSVPSTFLAIVAFSVKSIGSPEPSLTPFRMILPISP